MNDARRITKTTLAILVVGVLTFTGLQSSFASPKTKGAGGYHGTMMGCRQMDQKTLQARTKFLDQTVALRKAMVEKHAEMRALMNSTSPDPDRAAKLAGELFDIREQLRSKARENGLQGMMGYLAMNGPGCGCAAGMGGGPMTYPRHRMMK